MRERPTTDPKRVILDLFDDVWSDVSTRLDGMSDEEYLWEPVGRCWSVRADGSVDGAGDREAAPPPFTTIAWRSWHIAVDCLDSYSDRLFGSVGASVVGPRWHRQATLARSDLDAAWRNWRAELHGRSADDWWAELGDGFGPFAHHSLYDLSLHAMREVVHHGAEIACLRDLWRDRS